MQNPQQNQEEQELLAAFKVLCSDSRKVHLHHIKAEAARELAARPQLRLVSGGAHVDGCSQPVKITRVV